MTAVPDELKPPRRLPTISEPRPEGRLNGTCRFYYRATRSLKSNNGTSESRGLHNRLGTPPIQHIPGHVRKKNPGVTIS